MTIVAGDRHCLPPSVDVDVSHGCQLDRHCSRYDLAADDGRQYATPMTLGDTGHGLLAVGPGGLSPLKHDTSAGWVSGIWGLIAVLIILALVGVLVYSVRRGSSSDDED